MKKKLLFLASILAVVGLLAGAYFLFVAPKSKGAGEKTVTLEIVAGEQEYRKEIITNKEFVFEMLLEIEDEIQLVYNTDWGAPFVTGLLGVDAGLDSWFAFFVNEDNSFFGVSEVAIGDGDLISFILTPANIWEPAYSGEGNVDAESNLGLFILIAGLVACMGLMAYMIVAHNEH